MAQVIDSNVRTNKTQAAGAFTFGVHASGSDHQLSFTTQGTPTAGTLAIAARAAGGSIYEPVVDASGNAVSVDLTNPSSIFFTGVIDSVQVTPTGLTPATATYSVLHWEF